MQRNFGGRPISLRFSLRSDLDAQDEANRQQYERKRSQASLTHARILEVMVRSNGSLHLAENTSMGHHIRTVPLISMDVRLGERVVTVLNAALDLTQDRDISIGRGQDSSGRDLDHVDWET